MAAGSLRSGCWHPQVMGLFWVADFPLYPYMVEGARESSGAFLIKALIPFMGFPGWLGSDRIHLQCRQEYWSWLPWSLEFPYYTGVFNYGY